MSHLLLLILPLVAAAPVPQWSNPFFGADSAPNKGLGGYGAYGAPPNPYGPPSYGAAGYGPPGYGPPNPYGPPSSDLYGNPGPGYGAPPNPYGPPPPQNHGLMPPPQYNPTHRGPYGAGPLMDPANHDMKAYGSVPHAPPPPTPIDLMNAPKSQLPGAKKPESEAETEQPTPFTYAKAPEAEITLEEKEEPHGLAGTGNFLEMAKKEHRMPAPVERRPQNYGPDEEVEEEVEEAPAPPLELPQVEVVPDEDGAPKYKVNIGGAASGKPGQEADGPTNFSVWTDEGVTEYSSKDMNPETDKYIREKLLPKMRPEGRKKGRKAASGSGGGVFNVFGDKD